MRSASARVAIAAVVLAAVVVACSPAASPRPSGALRVVATTTVLADLVANVGGPGVVVTSLVPKGGEVHTFDPTPSTVNAVAEARSIVANGLGLDDWLAKLATDAGTTATILRLAEGLDGVTILSTGGEPNPHLWMNVAYARRYVARIADALSTADPAMAATFRTNAATYDGRLADLDIWAKAQIGALPAASRRIVSFHDAFPYFAAGYGLEIIGVVVAAPGQDPSAGEIAALVDAIRASGAKAVFSEAQFSDKLIRAIADEAGAKVESSLYDDTLGDPPVDSYEGLIRWDVDHVVEALR